MQRKKPMVPLMVEDRYEADGWLGLLLGTKMYRCRLHRPRSCFCPMWKGTEFTVRSSAMISGYGGPI
jgi:hypothetical protein